MALQSLTSPSNTQAEGIISLDCLPEEVLENIVSIVYYQSHSDTTEHESINKRREERILHTPQGCRAYKVYLDHQAPPILTTFQNVAVLNRRFHRLCLPRLWQKLRFPSDQPAPMSHWTENILLNHGNLVKSAQFELKENHFHEDRQLSETQCSLSDNTIPMSGIFTCDFRFGIRLLNIEKICRACPSLESMSLIIPFWHFDPDWFSQITLRLKALFKLLPRLQHLKLWGRPREERYLPGDFLIGFLEELPSLVSLEVSGFHFLERSTGEESFGWKLSQHQNLRKLSLRGVTFEDQTWDLNCWLKKLTTLELRCCIQLSPRILHNLLSGSAPCLTKLCVQLYKYARSDLTEQFILPALKELVIPYHYNHDLLGNFEGCKTLEVLECCRSLDDELWELIEHHISSSTWPKLSILRLRHSGWFDPGNQAKAKKEATRIGKTSNIGVFINKKPYRLD